MDRLDLFGAPVGPRLLDSPVDEGDGLMVLGDAAVGEPAPGAFAVGTDRGHDVRMRHRLSLLFVLALPDRLLWGRRHPGRVQ